MRMTDFYNILYETIAELSERKPSTYILINPWILLLFPRTWLLLLTQTSFIECPIEIKKNHWTAQFSEKKLVKFDWILFLGWLEWRLLFCCYLLFIEIKLHSIVIKH